MIRRLTFPDDKTIVIVLARILWWLGKVNMKKETIARILDISLPELNEIVRSPEYADEVRFLMRLTRNQSQQKKWVETYPNMETDFSKRMMLNPETGQQLIRELAEEFEIDRRS